MDRPRIQQFSPWCPLQCALREILGAPWTGKKRKIKTGDGWLVGWFVGWYPTIFVFEMVGYCWLEMVGWLVGYLPGGCHYQKTWTALLHGHCSSCASPPSAEEVLHAPEVLVFFATAVLAVQSDSFRHVAGLRRWAQGCLHSDDHSVAPFMII